MNQAETYFQDLAPLSCASAHGVTHEGVMPCPVVPLMGQARGPVLTWRDVAPRGLSHAMCRLL
jgi:hypothetical protein